MKRIAIYGKGGIGKSAIASNITASLAKKGVRVLQIGCDPKHDSTRTLLDGLSIPTVLDSLRERGVGDMGLDDIIFKGYCGCSCVETGGPEPGVGCAGRGILSTFELLQRKGAIKDGTYDMVIYDVLGDVVCGGFAVPLRREYSDAIYVVTSGEFMSLYATNNILKGVKNYDKGAPRVGGLICNLRGIENEMDIIDDYSRMAGVPIVSTIPRSVSFSRSERERCPLNEVDDALGRVFSDLSDHLLGQEEYYAPDPLDEAEMEGLLGGTRLSPRNFRANGGERKAEASVGPAMYMSKSVKNKAPLSGCAYAGAINTLSQIKDAITISHGPRSCSQISHQMILSSARRTFSSTGHLLGHMVDPPIMSTDMSEAVMIYGGGGNLEKTIERASAKAPESIFIVTTCSSGIIGDDVTSVVENARLRHKAIDFHLLAADGNISGDFMQGVIDSSLMVANEIINWNIEPENGLVNIIAEKNIAMNHEHNYRVIRELLQRLGIGINCRFICNTSMDGIRSFNRAPLNILASRDYLGRTLKEFFVREHGLEFMANTFPIGFRETVDWLEEIAGYFSRHDALGDMIDEGKRCYEGYMGNLRTELEGKSIMVVALSQSIDWLVEAASDLGMDIVKVGICDYSQEEGFHSRYVRDLPLELDYDPSRRSDDILDLSPDLVVSNYSSVDLPDMTSYAVAPLCPDVGFFTGVEMAYRWRNILSLPRTEGWRKDAGLK